MIKDFPIQDRDGHYLREMWALYEESMSQRSNDDYVVNDEQMHKLERAYEFFGKIASDCDGTVEVSIEPKRMNGGVTVYVTLFYLDDEDLKTFGKIIGDMSAISIDATTNGEVCLSFTIPDVFKKK